MDKYSDYNTVTRGYLRNYNGFKFKISNLENELLELREELKMRPMAPTARYGTDVAGIYNELNKVEQAVANRERLKLKISAIEENLKKLNKVVYSLENIFEILPCSDMNIIKGYYFEHKSWKQVADEYYMSERYARQKGAKIVGQISDLLFLKNEPPTYQRDMFDFLLK